MSRIEQERNHRKNLILKGALKAYSKNGIDKMTMEDIALESDFGKATIYYYFSSKEDILCSLLENGWRCLWNSVEEMVISKKSPYKKIVSMLTEMSDIVYSDKLLYNFLFTAPRSLKVSDQKATWKSFQKRTYATLETIVDEGIDCGDFKNTKPDLFMKAVGGMFHGIVFMGNQKKILEKDVQVLVSSFIK
ncbi:MAG: TetR/AcrR family transcriptional regulator [Pelagibacteraceae bacterium TMED124]|nr:hypothetical protein [Candidatus Neomarinimicrobiota bacterium]RPG19118.1 MAG: TetR/AcrR family transcriptional regulator [Pelagibacteraceae bacterium TMED124]|tara:strand:+ start:18453 stop:19025 length:573 start_codon:yes stop_codon:yes gene_type:complete